MYVEMLIISRLMIQPLCSFHTIKCQTVVASLVEKNQIQYGFYCFRLCWPAKSVQRTASKICGARLKEISYFFTPQMGPHLNMVYIIIYYSLPNQPGSKIIMTLNLIWPAAIADSSHPAIWNPLMSIPYGWHTYLTIFYYR